MLYCPGIFDFYSSENNEFQTIQHHNIAINTHPVPQITKHLKSKCSKQNLAGINDVRGHMSCFMVGNNGGITK